MALREIPLEGGKQLMFPAVELGEVVREIEGIEIEKKEANDDWNLRLKLLKFRMHQLARKMKEDNNGGA